MECRCQLCQAREMHCDPKELTLGRETLAAALVRINPNLAIWQYERAAGDERDPDSDRGRRVIAEWMKYSGPKTLEHCAAEALERERIAAMPEHRTYVI